MAPKDENELGHMFKTALDLNSPVAIRYPRGSGVGVSIQNPFETIEIGKAEILKDGKDILILAVGPLAHLALKAAKELKNISVCVVNSRFIKPLDQKTIIGLARKIKKIITIEENTAEGGFGSAVLELLEKKNIKADVKRMAIPDKFIEHGSQEELRKNLGLTKENIIKVIRELK
jgi:1-deoxy-D-xylulose-5-phosphate synthase